MADISITIIRDNDMTITASAKIEDAVIAEMAQTLTALLFDAACPEIEPPV